MNLNHNGDLRTTNWTQELSNTNQDVLTTFQESITNHKSSDIILKNNQQDATLYNVLYCCQCSTCFGRFFRSSSGAQELYMQHRHLSDLCVVTVSLVESERLNQANGNNTQIWQVPMLHVQFLSSWWWAEKPAETCRALTTIKNIV